jgi:hypothetical protein
MFFFNDECDLADDDQSDLFTLATEVERRCGRLHRRAGDDVKLRYRSVGIRPASEFLAAEVVAKVDVRQQCKLMRP